MAVKPEEMVIVDGVRMEPSAAPKKAEPVETKKVEPLNKARPTRDK